MEILVDTDIIISTLKKTPDEKCISILRKIEENGIIGYISVLTVFELYYGAYLSKNPDRNIKPVEELLTIFRIIDLSTSICRHSGEVGAELRKKGIEIDFRDLLIGVTALHSNLVLVTKNIKHFSRIKGLKIKTPENF